MYAVVGWRILHLAYAGKAIPTELVTKVFEQQHIQILQQITAKQIETVKDFILALGTLVGFAPTKKQPLPGEKLLWQAWGQMNQILKGWNLAHGNGPAFYGTG